jgi:hypothetical protein
MKNSFQSLYLIIYRTSAFMLLFSLLFAIVSYAFLLVFYTFSERWAMPIRLSANHQDVIRYVPQVIAIENTLTESRIKLDAARKASKLLKDKTSLLNISEIDIVSELKVNLITKDEANLRRAGRIDSEVKVIEVSSEIPALEYTVASLSKALFTAQDSPLYKAKDKEITLAFSPYTNVSHVKGGDTVYSCMFKVIWCKEAGTVTRLYTEESYVMHPVFKIPVKGQYISINFNSSKDEREDMIYVGRKPFLF